MSITLRLATQADLPALAELSASTFEATFSQHVSSADMAQFLVETYAPTALALELAEPTTRFTLAYSGADLAGYSKVVLHQQPDNGDKLEAPGELQRIYCRQNYLGQGIGTLLLLDAMLQLRQAGCQTIWLGVWEHNAPALQFYQKHGFRAFGEHSFRVGGQVDRDLLLSRVL